MNYVGCKVPNDGYIIVQINPFYMNYVGCKEHMGFSPVWIRPCFI